MEGIFRQCRMESRKGGLAMFQLIGLIKRIIRISGKYAARIKIAFVLSAIKSMLLQMPVYVTYLVLLQFYDNNMTAEKCIYAALGLIAIVGVQVIAHLMSNRLQSAAGYMMFADKRMQLGAHLKKMPMGYFTAGNIGKISSVLSTDMIFIEEVCMSTIADMMSYIFSSIVMLLFLFIIDWRLGIVMAVFTLVIVFIASKMNKISIDEGKSRQEQSERLTSAVLAFTEGIAIIKSFNLLGKKSKELTDNFKESHNVSIGFEQKMTSWQMGLFVLYGIGTTVLLGLGIYFQQTGSMSLPYLLGLLMFVFNIFGPLKSLYSQATRLTVMSSCLDRIEEVFETEELSDTGTKKITKKNSHVPEVQFKNVSFAYDKKDIIKNVNFTMKPNSMTALVGASGGGKSTIANLLTRFWDVKSGSVKIRGIDVRDVSLFDLMNHMSMVFQRVYLFKDTVYNNISMGKQNATKEEVYEAAKKARCYDFVMQLPNGFDTVIGEGGATLSGGEKQRISIARCILKDAPIVILDEATASVDVDNESYIQEAINELVKGKTLLVIAHRLNTIQAADQILVVDGGEIVQSGTHKELVEQDGVYKNYVGIRKRSVSWNV